MDDWSLMQFEDIKSIGVVGAGQMGRGIAQVCATAGYQVLLVDVDEPLLAAAVSKIRVSLDRAIERGAQCQTDPVYFGQRCLHAVGARARRQPDDPSGGHASSPLREVPWRWEIEGRFHHYWTPSLVKIGCEV